MCVLHHLYPPAPHRESAMRRTRVRRWGTQGRGFRLWGQRSAGSYESASDDEELLYDKHNLNYTNGLNDLASPDQKKRPWRSVSLLEKTPIIPTDDTAHDGKTHAVFPGGVYLHMASNPNPCDILVTFHLGELSSEGGKPSFVLPPQAAVYDHEILEPPFKGGPRSESWCDLFGIVSWSPLPCQLQAFPNGTRKSRSPKKTCNAELCAA